jgi:hypothetical protein
MKHLGVVDQLVKGSLDFIAGQISRPRLADNWAGSGEYEYAFLTALNASGKFPIERYTLKDSNAPFLLKLYDHYVEYGKRMYPNAQGMKGAGVEIQSKAREYMNDFINRVGGAEKFAFLFYDNKYDSELKNAQNELKSLQTQRNVKIGFVAGGFLLAGALAVIIYKKRKKKKEGK